MVNDDGPPSRRLSPYIRPFVDTLCAAGHLVSVAVPGSSRSWIGKAHIIEASLTATYVPADAFRDDGSWTSPCSSAQKDLALARNAPSWVVIQNGTPASCVQLGLYNLFPDRPPVDLVISGPNHGRNASTIYNLSSGTVGGALEAATCGKRGIAVSFGSKDPQTPETITAASRLAVKVIEHLVLNWDPRVELYNMNVPMRPDIEDRPVRYTRALQNYWSRSCLYAEKDTLVNGACNGDVPHTNGISSETKGNGTKAMDGEPSSSQFKERHFKWSADLSDMKKGLLAAEEGTDAHAVLNGSTRLVLHVHVFYICLSVP